MTTPPAADPPADAGLGARVGALEAGQTSILGKLDQLLAGPGDPPETEPERPEVNIAEEIRRQLAATRKAEPKAPAAPAAPSPAELAEKQPKAPVRRVTRLIWGDDE